MNCSSFSSVVLWVSLHFAFCFALIHVCITCIRSYVLWNQWHALSFGDRRHKFSLYECIGINTPEKKQNIIAYWLCSLDLYRPYSLHVFDNNNQFRKAYTNIISVFINQCTSLCFLFSCTICVCELTKAFTEMHTTWSQCNPIHIRICNSLAIEWWFLKWIHFKSLLWTLYHISAAIILDLLVNWCSFQRVNVLAFQSNVFHLSCWNLCRNSIASSDFF